MPARLGDDVDDFCIKCKRITNHVVVSLLNDEPAKVRCRTCHSDHDYRHEQSPPPKVDSRKAALFKQVLGAGPAAAPADDLSEPVPETAALAGANAPAADPDQEMAIAQTAAAGRPKARKKAQGQ